MLKLHSGAIKYLKNTSWLLSEKILRIFVVLFVGIWLARYLGPEQFGLLSYALSYSTIFIAISSLGLDNVVIRELVKSEGDRDILLGTAFILKIIGAIFGIFLLVVILFIQSQGSLTTTLILIVTAVTVFQSLNVVNFYFQAKVLSKFFVFSNAISIFFSVIIKVTLILNEAPLVTFAYVVLFDSFVLAIGFMYFYTHQNLSVFSWSFDFKLAKALIRSGLPLFLSAVAVSVYMKIDQIMIKNILGDAAVGQYASAARLSEAWYFIPMVIASSLFPSIIKAQKKDRALYIKRLQQLNDMLVWGAICIAIPVTFFGDSIILFLYGAEYDGASDVLVIHIWSSVFVFMTIASGKFLIADKMENKIFYRNLSGLVINILLNIIVIPLYGVKGAAITTLISWFVAGYVYDYFDKDINYMFRVKSNSLNLFRLYYLIKRKIKNEM
ncbi:MAG: flippase [Colwellia sp.]|nr:flippase [Colwellia sp.]